MVERVDLWWLQSFAKGGARGYHQDVSSNIKGLLVATQAEVA